MGPRIRSRLGEDAEAILRHSVSDGPGIPWGKASKRPQEPLDLGTERWHHQ